MTAISSNRVLQKLLSKTPEPLVALQPGRGRGGRQFGQPKCRLKKVPGLVPDIPIIHRLLPEFFASPTRPRSAWSNRDRDGGPGLPRNRQRQMGAAGGQRSDLRRQALSKLLREWKRGQPGRGRRKRELPLARRGSRGSLRRFFGSKAGRKSGSPKKGRGTSDGFGLGLRSLAPGRTARNSSEPSGRALE